MKKCIALMFVIMALPTMVWAQQPSNEELYRMIQEMERKFDAAIDRTNQALAEAAEAKEEAAKAKAELAQLQSGLHPASTSLVKTPETTPGFTASAEALYIRPSRSNLDFVITDPDTDNNPEGTVGEIEPDYQMGERIGLGYDFGSGTEIGVRFTGLKTHDSDSATSSAGGALWGTWLHPNASIDDNDVTSATARYDFEHYAIDFGARQKLNIGQRLGLNLDAGLRYASMNQDIGIAYLNANNGTRVDITNENDFSGWGPRIGMGLDWRVGHGFNVFSSVAGSLLLGDFDLMLRETDNGTAERADIKQGLHNRLIPVLEMKLGVGYARQLNNGWTIGANAGYEWQNWFNMVSAQRFSDDVDSQIMYTDTTDISLDGFFFEGFIRF